MGIGFCSVIQREMITRKDYTKRHRAYALRLFVFLRL